MMATYAGIGQLSSRKRNTMLDAKRLLDQFLVGQQASQPQGPQGQSQFGDIARNIGTALSGNLGGIGGETPGFRND
jgi:hypothetical protein